MLSSRSNNGLLIMIFTKSVIQASLFSFQKIASFMAQKTVKVKETEDNELGYSTENNEIFLSFTHNKYASLSFTEGYMMIKGVFAHELLHILITDFPEYIQAILRKKTYEQMLYSNLLNICEDGAIENFAPGYLSESYLHALRFNRATIYQGYDPINAKDKPLQQFMDALLQFRFLGFLKGTISDPDAKRIFNECVPLFAKCFETPKQIDRITIVDDIFERIKPLRETANDDLLNQINDLIRKYSAKNNGSGAGNNNSDPNKTDSDITKRRTITIQRIAAEEYEELEKRKDSFEKIPDGDLIVYIPEDPVKPNKKTESENSQDILIPIDEEEPEDQSDENVSREVKTSNSGPDASGPQTPSDTLSPEEFEGKMGDEIKKDLNFTEDEVEKVLNSITETEDEYKRFCQRESESLGIPENLPVSNGYKGVCQKVKCQNVNCSVTPSFKTLYNNITSEMSREISFLRNQLERIFRDRQEERQYKTSGNISVKRLTSGRSTARVFTKNRLPNVSTAVVIAVDMSGSMGGPKIEVTKKVVIGLAEVFAKLKVSLYIFGFTADYKGFDVNHYHFVSWKNTQQERMSLLAINALANNFDGYSIRYATELLRHVEAEKKF